MTTTKKTTTSRTRKKPVETKVEQTTKLPPNPFINEILDLVSKQDTKEKKVSVLREYQNDALKSLLIWNFDSSVISVLPSGEVPYRPNESPLGTDHSSLRREYKNLYHFVKGGNDSLSLFVEKLFSFRFWKVFIQMNLKFLS